MPRFSVSFGRRRSTVNSDEFHEEPTATKERPTSFRVMERTEVGGQKSFDGGHRLNYSDPSLGDNMFSDVKNNRYVYPFVPP
ncbi:hypothetical protein CH063_15913 [Colletotrichum higginsianum]|uniref:Uncharacterized protein n=1 Tax=Colletotrichum higginsianum (strain IMI 349063) TaxID=759273 RepID=H1W508_COLHI|nr:hypothetical protein CH063_15913 [Colletotrichum higginsianum]